MAPADATGRAGPGNRLPAPRPDQRDAGPRGRGRGRVRVHRLYGLPLPSPAFGVGSVLAVAGTGRLHAMAAAFRDRSAGETYDADALTRDATASLAQFDLVAGGL